jgi:hypothetical protein
VRPTPAHVEVDPRIADFDRRARLAQLEQHGVEVIGPRALHAHSPTGDCARHQVGTGLDPVRQNVVARAAQALDTLDHDLVGPGAADLRAHRDQEVGEIDDLRLARRVLDDRLAFGERRGHQQVLGAGDGDGLEHQARADQAVRARTDVAVLDLDVRAHRLQSRDVDVHGPRADRAAAGQRHVGAAEARQQRAQHDDRGAHRAHQLVGRDGLADRRCVDLDPHAVVDRHAHAHAAEQLDHGRDVVQVRHVADGHDALCEERSGENRQRGVLGARDAHVALERRASVDLQLVHGPRSTSLLGARFLGREHLHAQCMDFTAHERAQGSVDELVALDHAPAGELRRDDDGLEVRVVVGRDADLRAGQAGLDERLDGGGIHDRERT